MRINQKNIEKFWADNCPYSQTNLSELMGIKVVTPFIGAGMSVNYGLPSWTCFLTKIINENVPPKKQNKCKKLLDNRNYLEAATEIDKITNHSIPLLVSRTFSNPKISPEMNHYVSLLKARGINSFITTNYDEIIERTFCADGGAELYRYMPETGEIRCSYEEARRLGHPRLLKLHGTCSNPESIILTKDQYSRLYNGNSRMDTLLKKLWTQETLLFLGCSLYKDPLIQQMHHQAGTNSHVFHYAILEYPNDVEERAEKERWITELHIKPIWYPYKAHDAVMTILSMFCKMDNKNLLRTGQSNLSRQGRMPVDDVHNLFLDDIAKRAFEENKQAGLCSVIMEQAMSQGGVAKPKLRDLCTRLLTSPYVLAIEGEPGTGKSTLLSLLYLNSKQQAEENKEKTYFFLVDLHCYETIEFSLAEKELEQHLNNAQNMFAGNDRIILFVDGINYYTRINSQLEKILLTRIACWYQNDTLKKRISIAFSLGRMDKNLTTYRAFKQNNPNLPCRIDYQISLNYFDVCKSEFSKVVAILMSLERIHISSKDQKKAFLEKFKNYCLKVSGNNTELRTIRFLLLNYTKYRESLFSLPVGNLFYDFYSSEFDKASIRIEAVAKKVTHFLLDPDFMPSKYPIPYHVYKSPIIRDFFLALHYILSIKNADMSEINLFTHIFTLRINRYVVSLLNRTALSEQAIVSNCAKIYESLSIAQKNQVVYVLGRVQSKIATDKASVFLEEIYGMERKKLCEYTCDEEMMLFRSVGISLLYLNNNKYLDDFLELTIYNQRLSRVNRNFHVRYYQKTKSRLDDELHIDDNDCCSSKQLLDLYNHLYASIQSSGRKSLRYISIITLLNLVVYNHYINCLYIVNGYNPKNFEKLLDDMCNDSSITNTIVKEYILNIREYITAPNVYSNLVDDIYKLKDIIRTGWTRPDRRIQNPEEVSSHSWSACMLAQIFLADKIQDCPFASNEEKAVYQKKYDKSHIIKLLLVHDLAEIYIGDITPHSNAYAAKGSKEITIFKQMKALASFPNLSSLIDVSALGKEFIEANTFDAKIANDFDHLDALVQVYVYRNRFPEDTREEVKTEWIRYIDGKLKTTLGRNVFAFIKAGLFEYDYCISGTTDLPIIGV